MDECKSFENMSLQCATETKSSDSNQTEIESIESSTHNHKRKGYLSWNDYFMNVALLSAQRSKDPSTQVGACIVDPTNKIVGIGYNGMPINCDDDLLPWGKESTNPLENKYLYVCHAELNAILNKNAADLKGTFHLTF
jgi:dCMP deaminase